MFGAERHDIPAAIRRPLLLNMGANIRFIGACGLRTIRRKQRATVLLPVIKPASALTVILGCSVNVADTHDVSLHMCECLNVIRGGLLHTFETHIAAFMNATFLASRRYVLPSKIGRLSHYINVVFAYSSDHQTIALVRPYSRTLL